MPHTHRRHKRARKLVHKGLQWSRTQVDPEIVGASEERPVREKVFAEAWEEECRPKRWLNYGRGVLQDLMAVPDNHSPERLAPHPFHMSAPRWAFIITPREAVIVATVVQWLGTNVGWAWLESVVKRCGYVILPRERLDALHKERTELLAERERLDAVLADFERLRRKLAA